MLASLLCIQNRQVSGTPVSLGLGGQFCSRDDELFLDVCTGIRGGKIAGVEECKEEAKKLVADIDRKKVTSYVSVIATVDVIPTEIQPLRHVVSGGRLASRLKDKRCDTDVMLMYTVQCYLFYCKWKQQDDEKAALALLLF